MADTKFALVPLEPVSLKSSPTLLRHYQDMVLEHAVEIDDAAMERMTMAYWQEVAGQPKWGLPPETKKRIKADLRAAIAALIQGGG